LVTGGTTGIGFAIAQSLIGAGAKVMITGQNEARVQDGVRRLDPAAIGEVADNRSMEHIDRLVGRIRETFGRLDVLVAFAGVACAAARIEDISESDFAINFKGAFFTIQKCLPMTPRSCGSTRQMRPR
jgi:NAD(P)-dependent dehydrogenase (short-subunit alcohol dehydrogenase family)